MTTIEQFMLVQPVFYGQICDMFSRPQMSAPVRAVILGLIVLNIGVEVILFAADSGLIGTKQWRPLTYQNAAFWAGLLHNWRPNYAVQPYSMFVTYAFLHGGVTHLLGNMLTLWVIGRPVIVRSGWRGFLFIYLLAAIGGGAVFGLLSLSARPMVGASGALFGLFGALVFWQWSDRRNLRQNQWPVMKTVLTLVVLNIVMWVLLDGLLAWETHLGGFIGGWIATWGLSRWNYLRSRRG